jgi:HTH-type transcriptional regulator / antitoxin HigA
LPEQLVWLYRVRQVAKTLKVKPYSNEKLVATASRMAALRSTPADVVAVSDMLSDCGVRFVVVEALPGSKIDGVCTWLDDDCPVIGLSNLHDRLDNFWFVLRHEIEHVLRGHGRDVAIFDDASTLGPDVVEIEERQANEAAAEFCVPRSQMASFIARKGTFVSEADILGMAKRLAVHPAIVVGQYQFATKKWSFLRKYLSASVCGVRKYLSVALAEKNMMDGWGVVATVNL